MRYFKSMKLSGLLIYSMLYLLSSCTATPTKVDQHFGESTRNMMSKQMVDPKAGSQPSRVTAMDGRSAKEVIFNYYQSYYKPTITPNAQNFNVGNSGGGSANNGGMQQ